MPRLERGPVYLLGTGESVETPTVSQPRHSCESKISAADLDPRLGPATPAWSSPLLRLRSAVGEVQAYLRANAASLVASARRYLRG